MTPSSALSAGACCWTPQAKSTRTSPRPSVLVSVANRLPNQPDVNTAFDAAAKTIGSDHEYGRVARARRT